MPNFTLLTAGQNKANLARDNGIKISFGTFSLGAAFGHSPAASDTGLTGAQVYVAPIRSVRTYNSEAVDVVLEIPAGVGPFAYGEVLIMLDDGTPFAKLAYADLQQKLQTTAGAGGSSIAIHSILKIAQGVAIINLITGNLGKIPVYADFTSIGNPATMIGDPYEALVNEPSMWGQPVHLVRQANDLWVPEDYVAWAGAIVNVVSVSGGVTLVGSPAFLSPILQRNNIHDYSYILSDGLGNLCTIKKFNGSNAELVRQVSWISAGTNLQIFRANRSILNVENGNFARLGWTDYVENGSGMVGHTSALPYPANTVGNQLNTDKSNIASLHAALASLADAASPVGSVIASMSFPEDFEASGHWKLCNGQTVVCNTPDLQTYLQRCGHLGTTGGNVVVTPDLRGMFLRGIGGGPGGNNRDPDGADQEPSGNRSLNSFQSDAFKAHTHANGAFNSLLVESTGANTIVSMDVNVGQADLLASAPMLSIGASDTRPKNSGVHYYIRIRSATLPALV